MAYVLLIEIAAVLLSAGAIWALRRRRPGVFALFPVAAFFLAAALHGLAFAGDGAPNPGMLFGFGVVAGLFCGAPFGLVAAGVAWAVWKIRTVRARA